MPVENELKFILNFSDRIEKEMISAASEIKHIEQCYLHSDKTLTVRLRRCITNNIVEHILTVKGKTNPSRIVEIEKTIDESDYKELLAGAKNWLTKTRYIIDGWDVDFFKSAKVTYFAMAEIEMPDGMEHPGVLPTFIKKNLIYNVPRGDGRFSSKKISDIKYAKKMLESIL